MGLVFRQGFKNTVYIYLGFIVGAIYTILLVPKVFDVNPEHWGTARYLVSYAMIIAPWAQLSIPNVIIRYFPIFKEERKKDFMFFILFWTTLGVGLSSLTIFFLSQFWFGSDTDILILENSLLVFPIFIGFVLFEIAGSISRSLFKSTVPVFLKEFLLRSNTMILIVLYWYEIISFNSFILLFALNYVLVFIILFGYLYYLKALKFSFSLSVISDKAFKPIYTYALFSVLSTGAAMILLNIDTLMIGHFLTLKEVAIYGPSIYIASSIMVPLRAILLIVAPLVAQAWTTNSIDTIKDLYKKSAIAPLTITLFLFLMIWINIDLVMDYFGSTFGQGKMIILYLGLGYIVNVATGISGTIINTSKYFRTDLYFQIGLVLMVIIMNIIFIPLLGLDGAALATGITLGLNNLLKAIFIYKKFKIHPFSRSTILIFLILIIFISMISYLPMINSLLVSSLVYTPLIALFYWFLVYYLKISEDVNDQIDRYLIKRPS